MKKPSQLMNELDLEPKTLERVCKDRDFQYGDCQGTRG